MKRVLWQGVVEHYARSRSCYIYTLTPRRWRWLATACLRLQVFLVENHCNAWVMPTFVAKDWVERYRNWLGENRVGR